MGMKKSRFSTNISLFFVWKLEENKQNCHAKIKNTDTTLKWVEHDEIIVTTTGR